MAASRYDRRSGSDDALGFVSGRNNAITDVPGVSVGHASISEGDIQTGVTVVVPYDPDEENALLFYGKFAAGPNAEMTGYQVTDDFGLLSAPVYLTNLLSVGRIYNGAITYAFTRGAGLPTNGGWPPIVMGFDDRILNDMTRRALTENHALQALENARQRVFPRGNAGAGVGAVAFGFKGGIGTASRITQTNDRSYTVGVLVLANFGFYSDLRIDGILDSPDNPFPSLVGVVTTDAPLSSPALDAMAASAARGGEDLGRGQRPAGSYSMVSFSTGHLIRDPDDGSLYTLDFVEESVRVRLERAARAATRAAIIDALSSAESVTGAEGRSISKMPAETMEYLNRTSYD